MFSILSSFSIVFVYSELCYSSYTLFTRSVFVSLDSFYISLILSYNDGTSFFKASWISFTSDISTLFSDSINCIKVPTLWLINSDSLFSNSYLFCCSWMKNFSVSSLILLISDTRISLSSSI